MRRPPAAVLVASLVLLILVSGVLGWLPGTRPSEPIPNRPAEAPAAAAVLDALATLPLGFEPNVGQADAGVRYVARGPGYQLALSPTEASITLPEADGPMRMGLVGSNPAAVLTGLDALPGRTNYLTGADRSAWRSDVPTYARVSYADVWPGVDLLFLGDQRRLRHDFVVRPGADPAAIALDFGPHSPSGPSPSGPPRVDPATGDLLVGAGRLSRPTIYQDVDGRRLPVEGAFRLLGGARVGFTIGDYDRSHPLVIDPTLVTSSYLGGSGIDNAAAVEVDGGGNVYIVGSTESSDLKTTNPSQATLNGDGSAGKSDAFVAKLNPEGTSLIFATYLGGTNRDAAAGVSVSSDGSVFVTGVTESDNFPKTTPAAQQNYGGGPSDAFVTKLNANGSSVTWSTFIGGTQTDAARAVSVSPAGEAFVTGSTNSVEFPTANALQQSAPRVDDVDAFVTKLAPDGAAFSFSTRLGGDSDDRGLDIAVDATGNSYVTGDTRSPGFPTARPLQPGAGGSASGVAGSFSDAFVSKFGPAGNNLVYSTFLGGSDTDQGVAIAVDGEGAAYVTGTTNSPNFPVAAPLQARKDNDTDAFVTKVNPAGSTLVYSTYLGGGGADTGSGVVVDQLGAATVVGTTGSTNFPTAKPLQGVKGGGATDAFISTLASSGDSLVASSYLGGREDDQAAGIAIGPGTGPSAGTPVVVGSTGSADFPTAKPLQPARAGSSADAFVTRVSAAEAETPATTAGTAVGGPVTTTPASESSTHDRRVRLLVATTAGLFLVAVLQTAYLRRRAATASATWGPDQPEPLVPPPPVQTWGGGVRLIEDETDAAAFGDGEEEEWSGEPTVLARPDPARSDLPRSDLPRSDLPRSDLARSDLARSDLPVPDLLESGWGSPAAAEPPVEPAPPLRPAPRVPLEELSFWDLFPEDLPPSRRPGAVEDADWALEDQEDVLVGPGGGMPPPPPLPPMPVPWGDVDPGPGPAPAEPQAPDGGGGQAGPDEPDDDDLLLTELLDLSPAATREANASHYGNLIGAGGGDVGGGYDDDEGWDQGDEADDDDTVARAPGGGAVRSGSGSGPGTSGKRKRSRRGGRRRPKPGAGPGGMGPGGAGPGGVGPGGAGPGGMGPGGAGPGSGSGGGSGGGPGGGSGPGGGGGGTAGGLGSGT